MNNENKTNINWYPGHMAKTKREISEKIDLIDIVFEVIDARIPYSSKNEDINSIINNKPKIIIMTKKDLCDESITNKWKSYYENKGNIVVTMDLINSTSMKILYDKVNPLIEDMNKIRRDKGLKDRKARILVIGVPNVGKSTLINRLVGRKSVSVGNKPGITKSLEWIRINDKMELLDTPGILWPKLDNEIVSYNLASMTAIKEEVLNNDKVAIYIINTLLKYYKDNLIRRYSLTDTSNLINILDGIGKRIGAIKAGEVDYDRVYLKIIKDLQDGYLGKITFDRI